MPKTRCARVASAVVLVSLLGTASAHAFPLAPPVDLDRLSPSPFVLASAEAHPLPRPRPGSAGGPAAAPVLSQVTSEEVAARTRMALDHLFERRFDQALEAQRDIGDPTAAKLIEFFYVRDASARAPHQRIRAFLDANPDWPSQTLMRKRYELALMIQNVAPADVIAAFEDDRPISAPGTIALASAYDAAGQVDRAMDLIRDLWRTETLTEGEERLIRQRFGDALTAADFKARMDYMLYAGEYNAAQRMAERAGSGAEALANARITVARNIGKAAEALDKVPESLRDDPVYLYSRIQYLRRSDRHDEAIALLKEAPTDPDVLVDPDAWALERRIATRRLIENGDPKTALAIMSAHSARGTLERLESEWLAGWTALSFVGDPDSAAEHFSRLREIGQRPISVARATYWLGRAHEALGDIETAVDSYEAAAEHATTYYGQLAMNRIGDVRMPAPYKPIHAHAARRLVQEREPVKAARLLMQVGHERMAAGLIMGMAENAPDQVTIVGLAELATQFGMPDAVVFIGKQGLYENHPTAAYSFTRQGVPDFEALASTEQAAVFAIARQESIFNPHAVSHAGAMGLMQLMPGTASAMASAYSIPYDQQRLTRDAAYNAMLGSAYLADLVDEFGDAYALVFAAYNAGPGRVREWLRRFGDPRTDLIDPIDWVELIPFNETRNYVQRVMEGLQVYRTWLGDSENLLIAQDLRLAPPSTQLARRVSDSDDDVPPPPFDTMLGSTEPLLQTAPSPVTGPSGLGFAPATGFGFGGGQ